MVAKHNVYSNLQRSPHNGSTADTDCKDIEKY
jgi:hypothetical protein